MPRPRSFDETEVLDAASEQFRARGYAATSLDDLTTATGLGKGSLYGAFGDKHALFLRVLDEYCEDGVTALRAALAGPDAGALDRLRSHLVRAASGGTSKHGCLLAKATAELADHDDEVRSRSRATFAALEDAYADCVAQARRHGDLDPHADPRRIGALLLVVQRGIEALREGGVATAALRRIAANTIDDLRR